MSTLSIIGALVVICIAIVALYLRQIGRQKRIEAHLRRLDGFTPSMDRYGYMLDARNGGRK